VAVRQRTTKIAKRALSFPLHDKTSGAPPPLVATLQERPTTEVPPRAALNLPLNRRGGNGTGNAASRRLCQPCDSAPPAFALEKIWQRRLSYPRWVCPANSQIGLPNSGPTAWKSAFAPTHGACLNTPPLRFPFPTRHFSGASAPSGTCGGRSHVHPSAAPLTTTISLSAPLNNPLGLPQPP
jgi:hypothetical protein